MALLSDNQILARCTGPGLPMIEPFEPQQIRQRMLESEWSYPDGPSGAALEHLRFEKLISYGLSSYGYDIRAASQFKVFTNINSAIIDPKNFDHGSFVELEGASCIIPPNSFALARTVEYFRIPRNVLAICLGKSTYARCFSGDTQVALANGTSVSFKDMAKRAKKGERFFGYGISKKHGVVVTELVAPRRIAKDEELLRVYLDDGSKIDCTPDHLFLTRQGEYVQAQALEEGQSLMPLYRYRTKQGREFIYDPVEHDRCEEKNAQYKLTYWLADAFNLRKGKYKESKGDSRHHKDHDVGNDYPTNITRLSRSVHSSHHATEHNQSYWTAQNRAKASKLIRSALRELRKDPEWYAEFNSQQAQRANAFWHDSKYEESRQQLSKTHKKNWAKPGRKAKQSRQLQDFYATAEGKAVLASRVMPKRKPLRKSVVLAALTEAGSVKGAVRVINSFNGVKITGAVISRQYPNLVRRLRREGTLPSNHKVAKVVRLKKTQDVYCLTSPETGNFALDAGVFVKNCGIIVNVTPLEPEWEGFLTLEFSNTTPLPARIYANEGCAQLLFFQGDDCSVSYKDRNGKYQSQGAEPMPPKL